ncbi:aminopeptidase N-like isoform X2 [Osmia bicornis bicornis]|nr:aminopeptidase N-like isoform X2 [Osmia bicornis bicornis]
MSRVLSFVLLLVACNVAYGDVASSQAENQINYRLPNDVSVLNYELSMEPDLTNFIFTGQVKITIKVLNAIDSFTLNAKHLNVTKENVTVAAVDAKDPAVTVTGVDHQEEPEFLVIQLNGKPVTNHDYVLNIKFTGELHNNTKGFYRSRYFDKDNKVKYIATTHFEPTGARWAFPCWDEPGYKAPFTITITHLNNYTAIANTPLVGEPKKLEGNKLASTFEKSPPMSTYLVAFIVSDYECLEGTDKSFRVCTKSQAKEYGQYALDIGQKVIGKLNEYTGLNYNDYVKKMDQVTIKDFSPSAMENWGLVTYRETSLLYQEGVTTTRNKQSIATVIAHEFAHQWFGNLVSPKWWQYIWLNEGFATYMQYFITNELIPEWRLNETFVVTNIQGNAFIADAVQNVRHMNKDAQSPSEISSLFDSIGYQKAASVIRMMSHILTNKDFQQGLKDYLKKHQKLAATSDDLLAALQSAAGATKTWGGANFSVIMNEWVNKPGFPVVNVKKVKDGEFEVSQKRFLSDGSTDDTKWWVPLTYTHKSEAEFKNTTPVAWLKANGDSVTINIENNNEWILFNKLHSGYYRVNYDEENWKKLDSYLKTNDYVNIPPINRAQLIDDAFSLAQADYLDYTTALSLTNYLTKEVDYVPWSSAIRNLNFLNNMMRNSKHYNTFKKYIEFITKSVVKEVKFEVTEKESELHKMLRTDLIKWTCRAGIEQCTKYTTQQYNLWLEDSNKNSLDVDLRNTILCAGVRTVDFDKWKKTLDKLVELSKDEDEKRSLMLNVLGCSNSVEVLKKYLNLTLEDNPPVSFDVAVQGIVSEHVDGVNITLETLLRQQERIKKLPNADSVIKTSVQAIASYIKTRDEYVELSKFVAKELEAKQVQDMVLKASKNMKWLESNEKVVEKWLTNNEAVFNSATSLTFASLLVLLSIFITRFY